MGVLTRDQILQAEDLPKELVAVPEWGGDVYVRGLTGEERDAFELSIVSADGKKQRLDNLRARLVAKSVCDDGGARVFSDADAAALGRKSAAALTRVFEVAQRLSALSNQDVEDLAGNSDDVPSEEHSSGSAGTSEFPTPACC